MRSTPPPGMASRALVARLKRICSAACPSARTSGRSGSLAVTISTSAGRMRRRNPDRKSTRLKSSHGYISYAVFCLKKKKKKNRLQYVEQSFEAKIGATKEHTQRD